MKQITQESVQAFLSHKPFKKANMQVLVLETKTKLLLHGNTIAVLEGSKLSITNAGWESNTTKERLNALPRVSIYQRNFQWYLNGQAWNGGWIEV